MLKTLSELNRQRFALPLVLFCIVLAAFDSSYGAVAPQRGARRGRQGRTREPRERQGGRSQQAQQAQTEKRQQALDNAAGAIDTGLVEMLNLVNQGRRPNKKKLASTQEVIQESRKYLKQFQGNMACQFLMLNAWTDYFDAGAEKALSPANQAYRKDRANNDAHATQAAIAVLAGKKPLVIRPQRQQSQANEAATGRRGAGRMGRGATTGRQTRGRSRGQDTPSGRGRGRGGMGPDAGYGAGAAGTYSGTVSSGSILNLDADNIKADWLGRKIGPFSLNCLNGTTFAYNPAEANLCILFWKLAAADLGDYAGSANGDPNGPTQTRQWVAPVRQPQPPSYETSPGRMGRPGRHGDRFAARRNLFGDAEAARSGPVSMQIAALGNLFNSKFQNPEVKFVGINTNHPRTAPAVVARLLQSPAPWAQAILDKATATSAFNDLDIAKVTSAQPILAIVDKTGTVRYAGPAAGFLAPMVIDDLLGSKTVSGVADDPQPIDSAGSQAAEQIPETVTAAPAEPSQETSDTVPQATESVPAQIQPTQDTEITAEDFQAQKLLAYAQGLFIPAGRKKFLTSKMGVDLCRRIINEYSNTTYADEARKLLRTVPPHEQKRYNITNEEMGL